MLHLVESVRMSRAPRTSWTVASTALHAAVIAVVALAGTREVVKQMPEPPTDRIFFADVPRAAAPAGAASHGNPGSISARPALRVPDIAVPAITHMVEGLVRVPTSPWPAADVGAITRVSGPPTREPADPYDRWSVDRAVVPLRDNPAPEFPQTLRSAGVSGEVLARFVVDTTGRVEAASIRIPSASHELFADAVRRWLSRTRYEPAQAGGVRVRQLVEQRVEFSLTR
jgi:periplasmic protein TonB